MPPLVGRTSPIHNMSDASLTREEAIRYYGTEAATGWGKAAADQNFKKSSSSSSGGDNGFSFSVPTFDPNSIPVSQPTLSTETVNIDEYIQAIQDTLPAPPTKYLEANPFYFDEQNARDVSTAEFAPYYDELLKDYLGDIKLTSEKNRGDATRILMDLDKQKEIFFKNNGEEFTKTIRGIKEGYSQKGLYFSGDNVRTQDEETKSNTNKLESYLSTYGSKKGQTNAEDAYSQTQLSTSATNKARDIGRDKTAAIYGGINTQKDEAIDEYLYGMKTYYKNPNWASIDPTKLNPETGNTTLKQGAQY